jgi:integrase
MQGDLAMKRRQGIYKRGKTYWITYMLRGRQCFETTHSSNVHDAEALLLQRKTDITSGRILNKPSDAPLLSDLIEAYIGQIENPNTQKRYRCSQKVVIEHFGNFCIADLNAFAIDGFKAARRSSGVTSAGVNRDLALLRSSLNFAVKRRLIAYSPFGGVTLFNEAKYRKPPRILSFSDEGRVLACCDSRLKTMVLTLLETGMRIGIEALPLKWADVDFLESTITVVHSKTASGRRVIPMTAACKTELLRWSAETTGISEYVFFNPQRPATHIRSLKTAWHNALRTAGLVPLPLYNCRHAYATRLAAAGVSDTIIDQLLGHSRRDILRFYTGRVSEYLRDAINRLEQFRAIKSGIACKSAIANGERVGKVSTLVQ